MHSTNAIRAVGLLLLNVLITTTIATRINEPFTDLVEYNPFTDKRWPDRPSNLVPDTVFIQDLIDNMRVEYDLNPIHNSKPADDSSIQTIGPARFPRAAMPTLMPPPPIPQCTTLTTTIRKASPSGWTNRYGTNHGWAMVCYDQRDHTNYCYRSPRDYYCSSNGFLVRRETYPDGRYAPCEQFCRCTNINPRPNCALRWNDQTTCF